MPTVLDLFCGCGGMSLGFEKAGFNVLLGIDVWDDALKTYAFNHKHSKAMNGDLSILGAENLWPILGNRKIDIIIGGPPCQGFSIAGKHVVDDERNKLYKGFVRMVKDFKPKAFVMENVPNILSIGGGVVKNTIINDFQSLGYNVQTKVLIASDYGVPQNRKRAIFVGMQHGNFDFDIPKVKRQVTTAEALSDLPESSLVNGAPYPIPANSDYQVLMRKESNGVWNHEITLHNEQTIKIIAMVPDGGNNKDLPSKYQDIRKVHIAWTRLNSKRPSITIDTGHRHHFHYKWNRVPTVRECARIQSFPDDFICLCSKTSQYKQVGNAVPPLMAQAIAEHLKKQLCSSFL